MKGDKEGQIGVERLGGAGGVGTVPNSGHCPQGWSDLGLRTAYGSRSILLATALSACTSYEPASDTLPDDAVGQLAAAAPGESWDCLERGAEPLPVPTVAQANDRVVYSVQFVDLSTGRIYPDAQVRACGVADINCEAPVTNTLRVDAQGWVDLPLFRNFAGFLEVTSSEALPYLFYLTEPLVASTVEYPIVTVSLTSVGALVELLGVDPEPGTGFIALRAFDCDGDTAPGATVSGTDEGVPWYFVDGLPTSTATATGPDGLGGFVNTPPGLAVVDLKAPNGVSIRGAQSVVVRPNWVSSAYVRPRSGKRSPPDE
jgi:hypothetical protein